MAQKYVRHGATFNGDGTSSALATVDGGVGAWNDLQAIMTDTGTYIPPVYGTLVAGDTVYIRAQDATNQPVVINLPVPVNMGSPNGTEALPITWIVDDGNVWAGITGSVTFASTSSTFFASHYENNNKLGSANKRNLIFSHANLNNKQVDLKGSALIANTKFEFQTPGIYGMYFNLGVIQTKSLILSNVEIITEKWYQQLFKLFTSNVVKFYDVDLVIPASGEVDPIVNNGNSGSKIEWYGGGISGAGLPISSQLYTTQSTSSGDMILIDVDIPHSLNITTNTTVSNISMTSSDSLIGTYFNSRDCTYDSRNDGNYPTLSAKLPTSTSTSFSIKFYPHPFAPSISAILPISKLWTQAAKTLTVTANFLIDTLLPVPTTETIWIDYSYIENGTNNRVVGTTRTTALNASNIATSTALWSATSYGASNYNKHELVFTTPTAVKQDTLISIKLQTSIKSPASTQVLFIDPEILTV